MSATGQGGISLIAGSNHATLSPVTIPVGEQLTFSHDTGRRAFSVLVTSADGQVLTGADGVFVTQPTTNTIVVANLGRGPLTIYISCRWEEPTPELDLVLTGSARIEIRPIGTCLNDFPFSSATNIYVGDVYLDSDAAVAAFSVGGYDAVQGNVSIVDTVSSITGLSSLRVISGGYLLITSTSLTSLAGLQNLARIESGAVPGSSYLNISGCSSLTDVTAISGMRYIEGLYFAYNPLVTALDLSCCNIEPTFYDAAAYYDIYGNDALTEIRGLSGVVRAQGVSIQNCSALTDTTQWLSGLTFLGTPGNAGYLTIYYCPALPAFSLALLQSAGDIVVSDGYYLSSLSFPSLQDATSLYISSIGEGNGYVDISCPALQMLTADLNLLGLIVTTLDLSSLQLAGNIYWFSDASISLDFPVLQSCNDLTLQLSNITSTAFPSLQTTTGNLTIDSCYYLASLDFSALTEIRGSLVVNRGDSLTMTSKFPVLARIYQDVYLTDVFVLDSALPALTTIRDSVGRTATIQISGAGITSCDNLFPLLSALPTSSPSAALAVFNFEYLNVPTTNACPSLATPCSVIPTSTTGSNRIEYNWRYGTWNGQLDGFRALKVIGKINVNDSYFSGCGSNFFTALQSVGVGSALSQPNITLRSTFIPGPTTQTLMSFQNCFPALQTGSFKIQEFNYADINFSNAFPVLTSAPGTSSARACELILLGTTSIAGLCPSLTTIGYGLYIYYLPNCTTTTGAFPVLATCGNVAGGYGLTVLNTGFANMTDFDSITAAKVVNLQSNANLTNVGGTGGGVGLSNIVGSTISNLSIQNNPILPTIAQATALKNIYIGTGFVGTSTISGNGPG